MLAKSLKLNILKGLTGFGSSSLNNSNCYVGLLHSEPTDDGSTVAIDEVEKTETNNYERYPLRVNGESTTFQKAVVEQLGDDKIATLHNSLQALYFGEAIGETGTEPWGKCTYFGLFTSATGGTPWAWGQILDLEGNPYTLAPTAGQIPTIRKDQLKITLD